MRRAEANTRLVEAANGRIQPNLDETYAPEDLVIYLDKDDKWEGPGKVVGAEGNSVHIIQNGNFRKVAKC